LLWGGGGSLRSFSPAGDSGQEKGSRFPMVAVGEEAPPKRAEVTRGGGKQENERTNGHLQTSLKNSIKGVSRKTKKGVVKALGLEQNRHKGTARREPFGGKRRGGSWRKGILEKFTLE